jgi:non-heme chloroperoxidase
MSFRALLTFILTAVLLTGALRSVSVPAEDLSGIWQGLLQLPKGASQMPNGTTKPIRRVMKISRKPDGSLSAIIYSVDETDAPIVVKSVQLNGSNLTLTIDMNVAPWIDYHRIYTGVVDSANGSIAGTWKTPGGVSQEMDFQRVGEATAWPTLQPVKTQMIAVQNGVRLEVLDWGGTGRPVVLLAGLGVTAHGFFQFAPKLAAHYHVYGITRRGFGNSDTPPAINANYTADRLADDVLAVMDRLKIEKPVLIGHSIAGEELSSIGTRYPNRVAGLVYLDAGYEYAYYDPAHPSFRVDVATLRAQLDQLESATAPQQQRSILAEIQQNLPQFQKDLQVQQAALAGMPSRPAGPPFPAVGMAIMEGLQKYTAPINVPILAIFAAPHDPASFSESDPKLRAAALAQDAADTSAQADAFQKGQPHAKVIRIPNANHFVYISNETQVFQEVTDFINALPR